MHNSSSIHVASLINCPGHHNPTFIRGAIGENGSLSPSGTLCFVTLEGELLHEHPPSMWECICIALSERRNSSSRTLLRLRSSRATVHYTSQSFNSLLPAWDRAQFFPQSSFLLSPLQNYLYNRTILLILGECGPRRWQRPCRTCQWHDKSAIFARTP